MNILNNFKHICEENKDRIAVADEKEQLSFFDLDNKAKSLAYKLSNYNMQDEAIGILIDRSVNSVVAIFAVLYSGNYYVPLDPNMPKEKIESIIDETNMKVVINLDDLEFNSDIDLINDYEENKYNIDLENFDDNRPLYMVYTSGSTGKPKGVLKSHRSMYVFMETYVKKYGFNNDTVIGNQSPFYFDAAAKDLYMMMFTGARMEIIPKNLFLTPYLLIEYLNTKMINFISWVPSMLSIIVKLKTFKDIKPTHLKKVFFVGESFPIKHLKTWLDELPEIEYVNLFGSSEIAGVFASYDVKEVDENINNLPIGKPLDNCKVLLISDGEIVKEAHKQGELYVSSDSLAIEYYNDPEKTKEKFIYTDKYSDKTERYFITGDLAEYDDNNDLVFISRNDFQIKRMGHRIELGEIESIANRYEHIKQSCCVYIQDKQQLKLFCEVDDEKIDSKMISSFLKENLSDYMQPNKIIILDELPLNANGKINRTLLREM